MGSSASALFSLLSIVTSLLLATLASAQPSPSVDALGTHAISRISANIQDSSPLLLPGNHSLLARPEFESGTLAADFAMQSMVLVLRPSVAQQSALETLLAAQRDPSSSLYHQWLTPAQFSEHFGASAEDVQRITNWLQSQGFQVDEVTASQRSIIFSGTASQVERAFNTQMRAYRVNGESHIGNAVDPSIPSALAPVVAGVLSLHDFPLQSMHSELRVAVPRSDAERTPTPQMTLGTAHYITPGDLAVIYNANALYSQGINGSGQSVAVVARSNINLSDVQAFRTLFGLPANNPQVIVNGSDPGTANSDELTEATLDAEYAGALARNATVKFVASASTAASDGIFLSASYIVNQNFAPVMTTSFGLCEASMGNAQNTMINGLWQQAAAQGITVLVSAGDSGAAGCDSGSSGIALGGLAVNGLCSSPYSTCVGGTQFNDTANPSQYWSAGNSGGSASALGYVPEVVWNESAANVGLWAGGGGASSIYTKPSWQTGSGVPTDNKRYVPDVSLTASGHDGYIIVMDGQEYSVGGTSAASPAMASIFAMVAQRTGARLGLANPTLYALASRQSSGGAAVFHDTTSGNNSVPGLTGFNASAGYDRASGLGSVDVSALVSHWNDGSSTPTMQLALSSTAVSAVSTAASSVKVSATVTGSLSSPIALSANGIPAGVTVTFSPASIAAAGTGSSTMLIAVSPTVASGTYSFSVKAISSSLTSSANVSVTVVVPTFTLIESATSVTMPAGSSHSVTVTTAVSGGMNSTIALKATNMPAGVTATFSPSAIAAPGAGSATLTLNAAASVKPGSYVVNIAATAGAISKSVQCTLNVPSLTATASASSLSLARGASTTLVLTTTGTGGFNSAVNLVLTGLPSGVSAVMTPASIAAPGTGSVSIKLSASSTAALVSVKVVVTASGGGLTATAPLTLTVTPAPTFTLSASAATASIRITGSTVIKLSSAAQYGFSVPLTLTASGMPAGVTVKFSAASMLPGQSANLTITATGSAGVSSSTITVNATGGGQTKTSTIALKVTK